MPRGGELQPAPAPGKQQTTTTSITDQLKKITVHKSSDEPKGANKKKKEAAPPPPTKAQQVSVEGKTGSDMAATQEEIKLPQTFMVKYIGKREARGLWGIKNTRKPVDDMVAAAKQVKPNKPLPFLQLEVTEKGVSLSSAPDNHNKDFDPGPFSIDVISYGVQDLVYTRVFAMIVVREVDTETDDARPQRGAAVKAVRAEDFRHPFECYAFVCDSRQSARRLTFALAKAFQEYSKRVENQPKKKPKHYAIDLRTPEQMEEDLANEAAETEA